MEKIVNCIERRFLFPVLRSALSSLQPPFSPPTLMPATGTSMQINICLFGTFSPPTLYCQIIFFYFVCLDPRNTNLYSRFSGVSRVWSLIQQQQQLLLCQSSFKSMKFCFWSSHLEYLVLFIKTRCCLWFWWFGPRVDCAVCKDAFDDPFMHLFYISDLILFFIDSFTGFHKHCLLNRALGWCVINHKPFWIRQGQGLIGRFLEFHPFWWGGRR